MSALSLASLGVQCPSDKALSMASLGVFCADLDVGGGGKGKKRRPRIEAPGRGRTYEIAMLEDEEIIAVLQALLASRTIN